MIFASFRTEIDTTPIAEWVLRAGKTVCLPRIVGPRHMVAFRVTDLDADLAPGKWDIPEPREDRPRCRRRRSTSCSCPARRSTRTATAAATAAASTTTTCRSRGRARRGWRSPSRRRSCRRSACEPHDLPVTAIVTERRVIRPG